MENSESAEFDFKKKFSRKQGFLHVANVYVEHLTMKKYKKMMNSWEKAVFFVVVFSTVQFRHRKWLSFARNCKWKYDLEKKQETFFVILQKFLIVGKLQVLFLCVKLTNLHFNYQIIGLMSTTVNVHFASLISNQKVKLNSGKCEKFAKMEEISLNKIVSVRFKIFLELCSVYWSVQQNVLFKKPKNRCNTAEWYLKKH